jgi:hypothetical protein
MPSPRPRCRPYSPDLRRREYERRRLGKAADCLRSACYLAAGRSCSADSCCCAFFSGVSILTHLLRCAYQRNTPRCIKRCGVPASVGRRDSRATSGSRYCAARRFDAWRPRARDARDEFVARGPVTRQPWGPANASPHKREFRAIGPGLPSLRRLRIRCAAAPLDVDYV